MKVLWISFFAASVLFLGWFAVPKAEEFRGIPGLQLPRSSPLGRTYSPAMGAGCRLSGKTKGINPLLRSRLCEMSRELGAVHIHSGCRTVKTNRGARNSQHLTRNGCRAADVSVKGASHKRVAGWWRAKRYGGYRAYAGHAHVDVWKIRTW